MEARWRFPTPPGTVADRRRPARWLTPGRSASGRVGHRADRIARHSSLRRRQTRGAWCRVVCRTVPIRLLGIVTRRVGIDGYAYHRLLGEIRPGEEPPHRRFERGTLDAVAHARSLGVDAI